MVFRSKENDKLAYQWKRWGLPPQIYWKVIGEYEIIVCSTYISESVLLPVDCLEQLKCEKTYLVRIKAWKFSLLATSGSSLWCSYCSPQTNWGFRRIHTLLLYHAYLLSEQNNMPTCCRNFLFWVPWARGVITAVLKRFSSHLKCRFTGWTKMTWTRFFLSQL